MEIETSAHTYSSKHTHILTIKDACQCNAQQKQVSLYIFKQRPQGRRIAN